VGHSFCRKQPLLKKRIIKMKSNPSSKNKFLNVSGLAFGLGMAMGLARDAAATMDSKAITIPAP
jgi:hypothetical protein